SLATLPTFLHCSCRPSFAHCKGSYHFSFAMSIGTNRLGRGRSAESRREAVSVGPTEKLFEEQRCIAMDVCRSSTTHLKNLPAIARGLSPAELLSFSDFKPVAGSTRIRWAFRKIAD